MAGKKRKVDELAGEKSLTDQLKKHRERVESGDLSQQKPMKEAGQTPVDQAQLRAFDRIERLRKKYRKK